MPITAMVNRPNPDRLQLLLGEVGGPLVAEGTGPFDPRRDLGIYYNGDKIVPISFLYDAPNNRYLLYFDLTFSFDPVPPLIQVIHHMPNPPFKSAIETNPTLDLLDPGRNPDILGGVS